MGVSDSEKKTAVKDDQEEFFKPYRIKPAEVYVEPNPDVCREK